MHGAGEGCWAFQAWQLNELFWRTVVRNFKQVHIDGRYVE